MKMRYQESTKQDKKRIETKKKIKEKKMKC